MHRVLTVNNQGCYCRPGQAACGRCERCGAAGHTRPFPGPVPYMGAWCDYCYQVVRWTHPAMRARWLGAIVVGTVVAWYLLAG